MGINVRHIYAVTFGLAAAFADDEQGDNASAGQAASVLSWRLNAGANAHPIFASGVYDAQKTDLEKQSLFNPFAG